MKGAGNLWHHVPLKPAVQCIFLNISVICAAVGVCAPVSPVAFTRCWLRRTWSTHVHLKDRFILRIGGRTEHNFLLPSGAPAVLWWWDWFPWRRVAGQAETGKMGWSGSWGWGSLCLQEQWITGWQCPMGVNAPRRNKQWQWSWESKSALKRDC